MVKKEINIASNQPKGERKIVYAQFNRYDAAKSCYIELGNLQKSGLAINSEIQHLTGFKTF